VPECDSTAAVLDATGSAGTADEMLSGIAFGLPLMFDFAAEVFRAAPLAAFAEADPV
jgi:hypothetical protein